VKSNLLVKKNVACIVLEGNFLPSYVLKNTFLETIVASRPVEVGQHSSRPVRRYRKFHVRMYEKGSVRMISIKGQRHACREPLTFFGNS